MAQTIIPMIAYEDCPTAIDFLCRAFGFEEDRAMRFVDQASNAVLHAELSLGDGKIFLATPTPAYQSPRHHAQGCQAARAWLDCPWVIDGALVYVDDIELHFSHAKAAGVEMLSEIEEGFPGKRYRAADVEGHRWMFLQK